MDLPHQHRYQDQSSAKVFFEACLDTFESLPLSQQQAPSSSSTSASSSSSDTLVQHPPSQQQQQQQQQPSAAVDFNSPFDTTSTSSASMNLSMPIVYPLLAEALANEGFPGFASVLAFTQDQRQLEQVTLQSSTDNQQYSSSSSSVYHHEQQQMQQQQPQQQLQHRQQQQQQPVQDDTFLLDYMLAQENYTPITSSSTTFTAQDPALNTNNNSNLATNNIMGDMQPLELMQYNSLVFDGHYLDTLPYSFIQSGCGGDGPGMDPTGLCDSSQTFGFGHGAYLGDQFSQSMHIQGPTQQGYQQGYFDSSVMPSSSGSSSAGSSSSSSSASSSSSTGNFGFHIPAWSAGLLYPQNDYLMERKREGTGMNGHGVAPTGAVFAPGACVQPHFEPPEESDDDDDDEDEDDVPSLTPTDPQFVVYQGGDDSNVPPLALPSHPRRVSQKRERDDDVQHNAKRPRAESLSGPTSVGAHYQPTGTAHGHSRNSSISSVHSHSSSSSPSSCPLIPRPARVPGQTIEKRMHPCTFEGCDKSFTRAFNLRSHLNTHNGERPHKCPEPGCDWDFVRRHDLDRHVKSKHMANKPYACKKCTSRFGRSDALQRHRRLENHM